MNSRNAQNQSDQSLIAYLEGELSHSERGAVEACLTDSPALQQRLEDLRAVQARLSARLPQLEKIDLVSGIWQQIDAPVAKVPPKLSANAYRRWQSWPTGILAMAAVATLALWAQPPGWLGSADRRAGGEVSRATAARTTADATENPTAETTAVRAKGDPVAANNRWVGIKPYHIGADGVQPLRAGDTLTRSAELVFSYTNLEPTPRFAYLMIFAVDATGAVHWYYPAYEDRKRSPQSIPIEQRVANAKLREAVRHRLAPGPLTLVGLFSEQPLLVVEVERAIAERSAQPTWQESRGLARLFPKSAVHTLRLQVGGSHKASQTLPALPTSRGGAPRAVVPTTPSGADNRPDNTARAVERTS